MDNPQGFVTFPHRVHQNSECHQIVNLIVKEILTLHFLVNTVKVFRPARHFGLDPFGLELLGDNGNDLPDVFFPVALFLSDVALQLIVNLGVEVFERQVLQLAFDPGDTQALGQGCIDIQRFLCREDLFLQRHVAQGPHVMHAISELDQNDPHVLAHGQQHLAKVLCLLLLATAEIGSAELGDTVHKRAYLAAENILQFIQSGERVLDRVVQQAAHDARHIQFQIGNDIGHRRRVSQIRFSRQPFLTFMNLRGKLVCFADQVDIRGRIIGLNLFNQIADFDFFAHEYFSCTLSATGRIAIRLHGKFSPVRPQQSILGPPSPFSPLD